MKKKRKRKTRTGSSPGRFAAAALAALLLLLPASGSPAQKKSQSSYALIAGTVFRDSGLSLPGAQVTLRAEGDSKEARKFKKMQAAADQRGEFVFRVPLEPMRYAISVKASGCEPQEKTVEIPAQDGVDVFFRLAPASK